MSSNYQLFVGVDVAADSFVAAWHPVAPRTFPQTPTGWTNFQQDLLASGVIASDTLIVLEATGNYWVALAVQLHQAGFVLSVVNPAQVHAWAKSLPRRSKTDRLDAQLLAQFAAERRPAAWTPPPDIYHELRQRLVTRDGLLQMRQQARNQLHALQRWPVVVVAVVQQLEAVITTLDEQIKVLDHDITLVLAHTTWSSTVARLQTIPGLGVITIGWLLVATVNFSNCSDAASAASYAGLSPLGRESGTSVRGRPSLGHTGHSRLRQALYMASLSAAQHNPVIKRFYSRLRCAGKPMKVARCAAARKLLVLAYAVITKQQDFDPNYKRTSVVAA